MSTRAISIKILYHFSVVYFNLDFFLVKALNPNFSTSRKWDLFCTGRKWLFHVKHHPDSQCTRVIKHNGILQCCINDVLGVFSMQHSSNGVCSSVSCFQNGEWLEVFCVVNRNIEFFCLVSRSRSLFPRLYRNDLLERPGM